MKIVILRIKMLPLFFCLLGEAHEITYKEWESKIQEHFDALFFIGPDSSLPNVHKRNIYKDTHGSSHDYLDHQLRPNFPIAICVVCVCACVFIIQKAEFKGIPPLLFVWYVCVRVCLLFKKPSSKEFPHCYYEYGFLAPLKQIIIHFFFILLLNTTTTTTTTTGSRDVRPSPRMVSIGHGRKTSLRTGRSQNS